MAKAKAPAIPASTPVKAPQWTPEELMAVRHLGPGMIGQEKYDAAQAYFNQTGGGLYGPALLGSAAHNQAGPIKVENGVPIFAHQLASSAVPEAD